MFDTLQGKLGDVFRNLRVEGKVTPEVLDAALRQIRLALLEADVHFRVVKSLVQRIRERSEEADVFQSLTPDQQVIKIVRDELIDLLGDPGGEVSLDGRPAVIVLCGLQGSGKTTTAGKLGRRLHGKGRHPLLVAGDLQRAAAVEQLVQVGAAVDLPVLEPRSGEDVLALAARAVKEARESGRDVLIFDTAGRLHVDEALMGELSTLVERLDPSEVLFVADAMTGQDAVKSAGSFAAALPLSGAVLTKMDGDARGGAALSIRTVAKVPIRYLGVGERPEELELFHPERMASRILGMGDVLSLIEKAERAGLGSEESERLARRLVRDQFTLEDLRDQLRQLRKLGPLSQVMEMMPKVGPFKGLQGAQVDESELRRVEAIIGSMTREERRRPQLLDGSRKKRIAKGSGTRVQDVNRVLKQYRATRKLLKGMKGKWLRRALGT